MQSSLFESVPVNTARAARTVFNIENLYLTIGDHLDSLFGDLNLEDMDAFGTKKAHSLFILAMVTIFQYAEGLPDRQAADSVRTRLDWKYALHLSLDYPGIDYTVLSEFRHHLRLHETGEVVFQHMLTRLIALGLWEGEDKRQGDLATVLSAVDNLSFVEETLVVMRMALETLASRQPEWLRMISLPHWYERYNPFFSRHPLPDSGQELDVLAQALRSDVSYLLKVIEEDDVPDQDLRQEVQALRQICHRLYEPYTCTAALIGN